MPDSFFLFTSMIPPSCLVTSLWALLHPLTLNLFGFFQPERVALDFNLTTFAAKNLRNHCLDTFPKGSEARSLLAKVAFLENDFKEAYRQLRLSLIDKESYGLYIFSQWMVDYKGCTIPLYESKDAFSNLLINWVKNLNFPITSSKWANFWWDLQQTLPFSTYEFLFCSAIEIKLRQNEFLGEEYFLQDNLSNFIPILFAQKRFVQLKVLLESVLKQDNSLDKQTYYLFWFFRVKRELNEAVDDAVLMILQQNFNNVQLLEVVFSEWLQFVPDLKRRVKELKRFYKICKYKKNSLFCHYLSLLLINCYIELGRYEQAKKELLQLVNKADATLLTYVYELLAKNEYFKNSPDYRCAADYLEEAKICEKDINRLFFLGKLQAELYTLLEEYDRAYCLYQELLFKVPKHVFSHDIAYEWILCGIFCKESVQELEQQLEFCRSYNLFSVTEEEHLSFLFAKHQFELENFSEVLHFLDTFQMNVKLQESVKLLRAKCLIKLRFYDKAEQIFKTISLTSLTVEECAEYYLWRAQALCFMDRDDEAQGYLEWFENSPMSVPQTIKFQALLLRAQLSAKQHAFVQAKLLLLNACQQMKDNAWIPLFKFQAADYAAECGLDGQLEAIQILQSIYENFSEHVLSLEARLKQGVLLLNVKQYDLAYSIFENLLPRLQKDQLLWCRFLMIKCTLLAQKVPLNSIQDQLEYLLKETMPVGLRLEVALQLAYVYKDQKNVEALQDVLWNTCYPFFEERESLSLSVNEIYWLSRCLLVLAQYASNKEVVRQIYTWMMDAQLPNTSFVQHYLED